MAVESSLVLQTFHYEPRDTAAQRWTRWLPRLENFLLAAAIEKPERQKAMLLHHIDDELFAIYSTLTVPPPGDQQTVYTCAQQTSSVPNEMLNSNFSGSDKLNNKWVKIWIASIPDLNN